VPRLIVDSGTAHEPVGHEGLSMFLGFHRLHEDHLVFSDYEFTPDAKPLVSQVAGALRRCRRDLGDEEKGQLRTRLRLLLGQSRHRYGLELLGALYGKGHPYSRPPITERSLAAMETDDLRQWCSEHLVGANATLVIAGQFDRRVVEDAIGSIAKQARRGRDSADIAMEPSTTAGCVLGFDRPEAPLVEIDVGFVGGRGIDRDHAARLVLQAVLDARLSSLRQERALSYGFSASYTPRVAGGMWRLTGKVNRARVAEAVRLLLGILAEMRASSDSFRTEFVHARRKVVEAMVGSGSDSGAVIERLTLMERFGLDRRFFSGLVGEVARLRIDDLHAFLLRELAVDRQVFGAFGPRAAAEEAVRAARAGR
jgi:predicted Zn-dependent peptidase